VKRVIFSSFSSTYGGVEPKLLREDDMIKRPVSPYALHKYMASIIAGSSPNFLAGDGEPYLFQCIRSELPIRNAYALVVGKFLETIERRKEAHGPRVTACIIATIPRSQIVYRANILAMQSDKVGKGETFNIGNGNPRTVIDLVELLGGEYEFIPARPGRCTVLPAG